MPVSPDAYAAASEAVVWFDRTPRGRLVIAGPDRARFLHNLTTQEINALTPGRGCEAFITSPQGKTLGYVTILASDSEHLVRTDPGGFEAAVPHLQKYGVFDDVALEDRAPQTCELHLAGPGSVALLQALGLAEPASDPLSHHQAQAGDIPVHVIRETPTGRPGFTLIARADRADDLRTRLEEAGAKLGLQAADEAVFEALRIEAGTPRFGRDVEPDNLPQELGRDRQAISFTKGCYLGQETVARIDALGHVNKRLAGFRIEGEVTLPAELQDEAGKSVGRLTSCAFSPGWNQHVGLGIVRVAQAQAGRTLFMSGVTGRVAAVVQDLPMLPQK